MYIIWKFLSPRADMGLRKRKRQLLQAVLPPPKAGASPPPVPAADRPAPHVTGTIVELGPGLGANFKYYAQNPGVKRVVLIEPNGYMHAGLRRAAEAAGLSPVRYEVVQGEAEAALPTLPTGSVDAVVCTLVLCSVHDPPAVVAEVQRVLRRGGIFVFCEHVVADPESEPWTRRMQRLATATRVWSLLGDGCSVERDTGKLVRDAQGWGTVHLDRHREKGPIVAAPHVSGWAVKA
jgi:ubiquinone/menaquinone biosynthesis C-methylase UbiE